MAYGNRLMAKSTAATRSIHQYAKEREKVEEEVHEEMSEDEDEIQWLS